MHIHIGNIIITEERSSKLGVHLDDTFQKTMKYYPKLYGLFWRRWLWPIIEASPGIFVGSLGQRPIWYISYSGDFHRRGVLLTSVRDNTVMCPATSSSDIYSSIYYLSFMDNICVPYQMDSWESSLFMPVIMALGNPFCLMLIRRPVMKLDIYETTTGSCGLLASMHVWNFLPHAPTYPCIFQTFQYPVVCGVLSEFSVICMKVWANWKNILG